MFSHGTRPAVFSSFILLRMQTYHARQRERMHQQGIPQSPMQITERCHLPGSQPLVGRPSVELLRALRMYDRTIELIYDKLSDYDRKVYAASGRLQPNGLSGWHVYRRISQGASPANDKLKLELSCQKDQTKSWNDPDNEPCAPGMWLIEVLRRTDMTKGGAVDPERGRFLASENDKKQYEALEHKRQNVGKAKLEEFNREADKIVRRGGSETRRKPGQQNPKIPTVAG